MESNASEHGARMTAMDNAGEVRLAPGLYALRFAAGGTTAVQRLVVE